MPEKKAPNPILVASARVARLHSHGAVPDPAELLAAKQDMRAAQLEHHVRKFLAAAPPLTTAQRQRIAAILLGSAS